MIWGGHLPRHDHRDGRHVPLDRGRRLLGRRRAGAGSATSGGTQFHLTAYGGKSRSPGFHQIPTGNELVLDRIAADYWTSLYIATLALLVAFRIGVPLLKRVPLSAPCRRRRGGKGPASCRCGSPAAASTG